MRLTYRQSRSSSSGLSSPPAAAAASIREDPIDVNSFITRQPLPILHLTPTAKMSEFSAPSKLDRAEKQMEKEREYLALQRQLSRQSLSESVHKIFDRLAKATENADNNLSKDSAKRLDFYSRILNSAAEELEDA